MLHMQVDCICWRENWVLFASFAPQTVGPDLLATLIHVIDGQITEQLKMPGKAQEKVQIEPLLFLQEQLGSVMMWTSKGVRDAICFNEISRARGPWGIIKRRMKWDVKSEERLINSKKHPLDTL